MATTIVGVSDPHWSDRKPRRRKDEDFQATQLEKLSLVLKVCTKVKRGGTIGAAAVVFAGDLFHYPSGPRISRRLDGDLAIKLREFPCPRFCIPGNHDMEGDRPEALRNHPYGALCASGVLEDIMWPKFAVVGDPPVLIVGLEYRLEGPIPWLNQMRETEAIYKLREREGAVGCLAMTHCFWGPADGESHGEVVVGHRNVVGTGIDVMLYGHPHSFDGIVEVEGCHIVGPGSLIRGTIAEHDVTRKPAIMVATFTEKGHKVETAPIPVRPAEDVLNLEAAKREKKVKEANEAFVDALASMEHTGKSSDELLDEAASSGTPANVVARSRELLLIADQEVKS